MKVCLGGTFNTIHAGHELLLQTAFAMGEDVIIGLSSDELANQKHNADPYPARKAALSRFLEEHGWKAEIVEINDFYGFATKPDYEAIVVSEETLPNAHLINEKRMESGLEPLKIAVIPIIKNENGEKVSSSD